jgi:cytochrome b subunit of formate dehydrogenase
MISFTILVISGFSLRFSDASWVKLLFGWEGGFEARGVIHRVAAAVMVVGSVWHLLYLFTARGRHWFRDMTASWSDWTHIRQNAAYFLGLRKETPQFGRFSYMEKIEYWALAWGTVIMSITGVLLWFDDYFVGRWGLPKGFLDVMLVIHYYEAWLAFLAIVVWHLYGTLFKPGVYPMNPSWLTGKMPREMYVEEHPDGPKLKVRTVRIRYEDEEEPGDGKTKALSTEGVHTADADRTLRAADRSP